METDLEKLNRLKPAIREYQNLAIKHNINDIFQDNGGKYVEIFLRLGLTTDGSREGNDAIDSDGNEYEIKTLNIDLQRGFSTHHHLNPTIISKYRKVHWLFVPFRGIEIQAIYKLTPQAMSPFYDTWEEKWNKTQRDLNNPKIPLKYVIENGILVWLPDGVQTFTVDKLKKDPNRPVHKRSKIQSSR